MAGVAPPMEHHLTISARRFVGACPLPNFLFRHTDNRLLEASGLPPTLTRLCRFRVSYRRHSDPASSATNSGKRESSGELVFEKGIFETNFISKRTEVKRKNPNSSVDCDDGLVPEDWKFLQQDLHKTKAEKKREFRLQEMENAQLNELRAQLQRQKIELISSSERPSADSSLPGLTQLPDRIQLLELEKMLSSKPARKDQPDSEFDHMFTHDEKWSLKRRIPDFSQIHCEKWPVLHMLVASGQYFFLEQLLKFDIDVNAEDEDGYTALQRAVQGRKETAVSQLLNAGAHVNVCDKDGANLLHFSVQIGSLNLVRLFVKHGVQVNHADKYGWTPLHVAVMTGRDDIVRHLILSEGDKSLKNKDGLTPLDIAVALGKGFNSYAVAKALKKLPKVT